MALLDSFICRVQKLAKHASFRLRLSKYYDVMVLQRAVRNKTTRSQYCIQSSKSVVLNLTSTRAFQEGGCARLGDGGESIFNARFS
jgi:hypothetical protein